MSTTMFLLCLIVLLAICNIVIAINLGSAFRALETVTDILAIIHHRIEELENKYERRNPDSN